MTGHIIAVSNQKGGVGKTTTTINLAQALSLKDLSVLVVDLDPQGNATQGMGIQLDQVKLSISDLLKDKQLTCENVIYQGSGVDLIPSTPLLARFEREMIGMTNSEFRLAQRLAMQKNRYDMILVDTPPTFGPLLNSALNAADKLIVPVDAGYFAMMGIKELLAEVQEIQSGSNAAIEVLGYLFTMTDNTKIASETWDGLVAGFGDQVFETRIRRNVKLKEAPVFGKTIFHHAPLSSGAEDYHHLATEVTSRLGLKAQVAVGGA